MVSPSRPPTEGEYSEENSLKPVANDLSAKLGRPVRLIKDWVDGGFDVAAGDLVLLENVRFNKGGEEERRRDREEVRPSATSSSWTRSAPLTGPKARPTASPSSPRWRARAPPHR